MSKYKHTCFLIDDDIDDQELFEIALKKVDNSIAYSVANNGVEAIKRFEEDASFVPDIIFLDVNMPKMNGLQCLAKLKELPQLHNVKIVMYTTSSDPAVIEESKRLGAADFQTKPTSLKTLIERLSVILAN